MAIEISIEDAQIRQIEKTLASLKPASVSKAVQQASSRAVDHAKKVGWDKVKSLYTAKQKDVYANISKRRESDGTVMVIRGAPMGVEHYKARKTKKRGVFVTIKRANTFNVSKGFAYNKTFFQRHGKPRFPIDRLFGPAAPQLFGNPETMSAMEKAGMETYEKRLMHELDRLIGN